MRNGRILAEDTPDNIMEKFKMQVSHQYIILTHQSGISVVFTHVR